MLQIKNISKQYKTGDLIQDALKDVSLNLRDNEFVSILGPSGSGKTTLLNIIGGLDRYDSGDLIINNVSTVEYEDRDWDSYRNHTIGFVFQSYNLIPHQTVLANVELALTIGGISKKERRNRALKALEEVGLREQAHKKPNQMSGGQMQRVAIARALVNNPDILLADEPTGALDTETSVQVMELLKKVANDRLVIMVTHNPELAEEYSTRIVRLKDGEIIDDTDPFVPSQEEVAPPEHRNLGKASMSIMTALSLSFNNLLTKKGRTILTAFAGSIGIIGIALILSLSTGFQNYIDQIQEDTLTSYPLTLTAETADTTSMLLSMVSESGAAKEDDVVKEQKFISSMLTSIGKNDLALFKDHLERNAKTVDELVSIVEYQYNITPLIYTVNSEEKITQLNPSTVLTSMGMSSSMSSMSPMSTAIFNQMLDDRATLEAQYDVLA
ncbi:MAG: ABC transporter ATP-binding protein, partial [Tyzzerella sp.]|nr:ABC transporter ATP-binding protein [Tyzzerella sp.]